MRRGVEKPRDRWRRDVVGFVREVLIDPETRRPFELYAEEITFLRQAFTYMPDGRLRFTELCFSAGKKSGKTGLAAMIVIFTAVVLAGPGGEIYCLANDLEQSASRVFKAVVDILKASPLLRGEVEITATRITFKSTGTFIAAVSNDFAGFSGANPTLNVSTNWPISPPNQAGAYGMKAYHHQRAELVSG
jgi:hypothetical protein